MSLTGSCPEYLIEHSLAAHVKGHLHASEVLDSKQYRPVPRLALFPSEG